MNPNTRLLIRFTLDNGMKSWGYDYPHYQKKQQLIDSIVTDFTEWPENTEIHLFYENNDEQVTATDATELADAATAWLKTLGAYNGN